MDQGLTVIVLVELIAVLLLLVMWIALPVLLVVRLNAIRDNTRRAAESLERMERSQRPAETVSG